MVSTKPAISVQLTNRVLMAKREGKFAELSRHMSWLITALAFFTYTLPLLITRTSWLPFSGETERDIEPATNEQTAMNFNTTEPPAIAF